MKCLKFSHSKYSAPRTKTKRDRKIKKPVGTRSSLSRCQMRRAVTDPWWRAGVTRRWDQWFSSYLGQRTNISIISNECCCFLNWCSGRYYFAVKVKKGGANDLIRRRIKLEGHWNSVSIAGRLTNARGNVARFFFVPPPLQLWNIRHQTGLFQGWHLLLAMPNFGLQQKKT